MAPPKAESWKKEAWGPCSAASAGGTAAKELIYEAPARASQPSHSQDGHKFAMHCPTAYIE